MMEEKLFFSPAEFPGEDTQAIQAAVDAAKEADVCVVAIQPKTDGTPWHLTAPVKLPEGFTVILDGAVVEAEDTAFINSNAGSLRNLGGEQNKIFILGRHGGLLRGLGDKSQILLSNVRDCRIADLSFEGGSGICLEYVRYSKLQQLKVFGSVHGVTFREGCNNIILESLLGETEKETICTQSGDSFVMGRKKDIYNSIFCRIQGKTGGAPVVRLEAGENPLYNIVLRDVTDDTSGEGCSVVIGGAEDAYTIRDLTVRGVSSLRDAVRTKTLCDGMFFSNLHPGEGFLPLVTEGENTRQLLDDETMEIVLPQFPEEKPDRPFITPNDPAVMGKGDGESIQNAVDLAAKKGIGLVVIPRWNVRRQQALWDVEKAVRVPSNMTIVFLHAYLKIADFSYENMFTNSRAYESEGRCIAHEEHDLTFTGIGDAVLDGGLHNGLLEKNCNLYGFPDKRLNATVLFNNVRNLVLENFQFRQSRWYGTYFIHCDTCRISNIDFDFWEDSTNRDGVDIRSGCHNFLVENITGTTGDDTVALNNLGNDGNDGRYVEGKDPDTLNMVIRNVKSDAGRWFNVRLLCQDRHLEQNFTIDTVMDVSEPENQKSVNAVVMIGSHEYFYKIPGELGDLAHLSIRDVYSRCPRAVSFGGCVEDVAVSNIHVYGDGCAAVSTHKEAKVKDIRVSGVFHKRDHLRLKLADTADTDLQPVKAYESTVIDFVNLETDSVSIRHVYGDTARMGVRVTGNAKVTVEDFSVRELSDRLALCGADCYITINGDAVAQTPTMPL